MGQIETAQERATNRRKRAGFSDAAPSTDRLPPHSPESEQGILGCCLLDGSGKCVAQAVEYFHGKQPFFDLRHAEIFAVLQELQEQGEPVDLILVQERLRQRNRLEEVGGLVYLTSLPETVPSSANLPYYLDIVFEKYVLRRMVHTCTEVAGRAMEHEGQVWQLVDEVEREINRIKEPLARNTGTMPVRLKDLNAFEQEYMDLWFGSLKGEPGLMLPECFGDFPFKVRRGEMSFLIAEKGAGKSTLLAYILLHLMSQGEKACIASMEMKPAVTIKLMASQLLGRRELQDTPSQRQLAMDAYVWLAGRLMLYDFTGIAEWREILNAFDFAVMRGFGQFQIDSVMRLGIADDDYAEQGRAARSLANWALSKNAHLWVVNHLNKSERSTKQRSRGSQQWIDNSNNVMSVHMNEEKHEFIESLREELRTGQISASEFDEKLQSKATKYDSQFVLHNQRWPGSRQNGSRYLYFNRDSLQLNKGPFDGGQNWLGIWQARKESA